MASLFVPPIKCQGIKTKLVPWIKGILPEDFKGRWVEPFMGSGVVAFNIKPRHALLADSNPHLITFYQAIKDGTVTERTARVFLQEAGKKLEAQGEDFFYEVRERFNKEKSPFDFLFLNRACFNGLIRFNRAGCFNVPFCRKPDRFAPAYITKICNQIHAVSILCATADYQFLCQDFSKTISSVSDRDILYCNPPYIDRYVDYFNGWNESDEANLFHLLDSAKARFILSTWQSNQFRENIFIRRFWSKFPMLVRNHFYYVGPKEENRHPMVEALVMNFSPSCSETTPETSGQLAFCDSRKKKEKK